MATVCELLHHYCYLIEDYAIDHYNKAIEHIRVYLNTVHLCGKSFGIWWT